MNWWMSQFVLGFALTFWPAPLVGLWLMAERRESAPKQDLVPQSYGPLPEFTPGPKTTPPEQPESEPELEPEVEPMATPGSYPGVPGRHNLPESTPRPTDGRPPL